MGRIKGRNQQESEEKKQEIIRLYKLKARLTMEEIGSQVGDVSKQYVWTVLDQAGLLAEEREEIIVADTIREIQRLSGWSLTEMGIIMNIARETITRWANGKPAAAAYARRLDLLARGITKAFSTSATLNQKG